MRARTLIARPSTSLWADAGTTIHHRTMDDSQTMTERIGDESLGQRPPSTATHAITVAIVVLPALATAAFLLYFGVDVPYFDEWDLAPLVDLVAHGKAGFADFHEQHGVHRILIPKFLLSHLAVATGWNVRVEMALNLLLALMTLGALQVLSRRTIALDDRHRLILSLATSVVLFSPVAVESWLSGWHIGWFLTNACMTWAIVILIVSRLDTTTKIAISAILCLIASFSIAHGLVTWLALAPAVAAGTRKRLPVLAVWIALFALTVTMYFHGYEAGHPELTGSVFERTLATGLYFLALLGSPLAGVAWLAVLFGVLLVIFLPVLAFKALHRVPASIVAGWFSLTLYVFGFAAANALGRAGWGVDRALSSPYKLVSALSLIIVLHLLLLGASLTGSSLRLIRRAGWTVVIVMVVAGLTVVPHAAQQRSLRLDARLCLQAASVIDATTSACRPALAWPDRDPMAEARRLDEAGVFDLPDRSAFTSRMAPGAIDATRSGWESVGRTGRQMVIRGHLETEGRERTLLVLTRDPDLQVVATRLLTNDGEMVREWSVELPQTRFAGVVAAWVYDPPTRSFLRLHGLARFDANTGGPFRARPIHSLANLTDPDVDALDLATDVLCLLLPATIQQELSFIGHQAAGIEQWTDLREPRVHAVPAHLPHPVAVSRRNGHRNQQNPESEVDERHHWPQVPA